MKFVKYIVLLSFLIQFSSWAAETDGFTERYRPMPDAVPFLNAELDRKIQLALKKANQDNDSRTCSWTELNEVLGEQLRRPIFGVLEEFIDQNPTIPKTPKDFDHSVYQHFPLYFNVTLKLGIKLGVGYASAIYHNGLLVGGDKFGHFMDEGYYYYTLVHTLNQPVSKIFEFGSATENTINGKWSSGVFSYADLAANYDGFRFWNDLIDKPKSKNSKYITCENGDWKLKKQIDLAEYISPAWDEGMNCNDFRSSGMSDGLEMALQELEQKTGKRFRCPVYPDRVSAMIKLYEPYSSKIIHPSILQGQVSLVKAAQ